MAFIQQHKEDACLYRSPSSLNMTNVSKQLDKAFCLFIFFRKRRTSCDVMFSAALRLWLIYHQTTSGDCTNTVITCLSDAAGQRTSMLHPFLAWRSALHGGGGGRGAVRVC